MLTLAKDKMTDYRIVKSAQGGEAVAYAAQELAHFLKQITGAEFPIYDDDADVSETELWVGKSKRTEGLDIDWTVCKEEGYYVKNMGDSVLLAGSGERGTLYAVYDLLEEELGCRWFTPKHSHVPKRENLAIRELDKQFTPVFKYRSVGFIEARDGDFAARNRLNAGPVTDKHGGKASWGGGHSFDRLVPPSEFFEEHPEFFSEIDGKRVGIYDKDGRAAQLCLTNPEVLEIALERVMEALAYNPEAIVPVAQNDGAPPCTCEKCRAVDFEEESNAGTLMRFVNAIAAKVKEKYPKAFIQTYAYNHTRRAPKYTKPLDNVIIHLCTGGSCFLHPLEECSKGLGHIQREFILDFNEWTKIVKNVYIFDYPTNYAFFLLPHPTHHVFRPNYELFAKNGICGVYGCGVTSRGAYCAELKSYVLAKSMWNPYCDDELPVSEFLVGVYGMAAPVMERIFDAYRKELEDEGLHIGDDLFVDVPYNRPGFLESQDILFDEAERLADDKDKLHEVKKARIWQRFASVIKKDHKDPQAQAEMDALASDMLIFGMKQFCIHWSMEYWLERWKDRRFQD